MVFLFWACLARRLAITLNSGLALNEETSQFYDWNHNHNRSFYSQGLTTLLGYIHENKQLILQSTDEVKRS